MRKLAFFVVVTALGILAGPGCEKPPPVRADVDEDCSDTRCEDGLICVDRDDADDEPASCAEPDPSCDPDDICECDLVDDLCPEESIGNVCISIGTRATLECALPEGGEGEGEGE